MIRRRSPIKRTPIKWDRPRKRLAAVLPASSCPELAIPKGPTRKQLKGKYDRADAARVKAVRVYVFDRERDLCVCCASLYLRVTPAESMHEVVPRSIVDPLTGNRGIVSPENSIAVCGDGVRGCHGKLQRHEIRCVRLTERGADGPMLFGETR